MNSFKLAVLIPYYKRDFFDDTLRSLANQTDKRFNVYISDDSSPNPPNDIIDKYKEKLNIFYKRYKNNLGRIDLVGHWNRSLELIKDEEWVWCLPDDDMASENVVEEFYKNLENVDKYNIKVFRMIKSNITIDGKIVMKDNINENVLSAFDFYKYLLKGNISASLGENIFHKNELVKEGFINFYKGWNSDHATIINISKNANIYILKNTFFYFRMSSMNISYCKNDYLIKIKADIAFCKWLQNNKIFLNKNNEILKLLYLYKEHFILSSPVDLKIYYYLYKLRIISMHSFNILPIIKIFF